MLLKDALRTAKARADEPRSQEAGAVFFVVYDPTDGPLLPLQRRGYAVLSEDTYQNSTIPEARCLWSTAEGWYEGSDRYVRY